MLSYPDINPVAFSLLSEPIALGDMAIGPFRVHWYGIMYLFAFASAWMIALYRAQLSEKLHWPNKIAPSHVENLVTYCAFGVILGGRLGYVFFYNFNHFLQEPLMLFRVWEGGMSFHGGLLGVIIAMFIYARKAEWSFVSLMDFVAPCVPTGLFFGRLGNFIGQELWGRVSDVPWAMVFPKAMDPVGIARHPSQLYEAFLEGVVLFAIVFWFSSKPRPRGTVSGIFLLGYSSFRFFVEFFREPDLGIGFDLLGWMTRGQLLCVPMFLLGVWLFVDAYYLKKLIPQTIPSFGSDPKKSDSKIKKNKAKK
jgi:phosphatidylglycerol---prolipoprotein diacylglyceryl transferase